MSRLLNSQDALDPSNDFVGRRVTWLIQVDEAGLDVLIQGSLFRRTSVGKRSEVTRANVQPIKVLEQQRPVTRVDFGTLARWLQVVLLSSL